MIPRDARRHFRSAAFLLAILLLAALPLPAQAPLPTARELIDRVVARARRLDEQKLLLQYTYRMRFEVEKLDDDGKVKETEVRIYEPVVIDGARFMRMVEKDGAPLTAKENEQEEKREREFRKRLAEERKKKESDRDVFKFDEHLIQKYDAEVRGREVVNGRPALVLTFRPKEGDLPARGRYERLLNHVAGTIWIDEAEAAIVRAEGKLLESVKWGWGLVASIHTLNFSAQQTRVDDDIWLPQQLDAYVQGRVVFSGLHQRQRSTWTDFRKPEAGAGSPQ